MLWSRVLVGTVLASSASAVPTGLLSTASKVDSLMTPEGRVTTIPQDFSDLLRRCGVGDKGDQAKRIADAWKAAKAVYDGTHRDEGSGRTTLPGNIRTGAFMDLRLSRHPKYESDVLRPMTTGDYRDEHRFLDVGARFGVAPRKLIMDGVSAERVYASDTNNQLVDIGLDLFDGEPERHLVEGNFIRDADILDKGHERGFSPSNPLRKRENTITILHLSSVFHQYDVEQQTQIIRNCLKLLRKDTGRDVVVIGGQSSTVERTEGVKETLRGTKSVKHSEDSWVALWEGAVAASPFRAQVRDAWARPYARRRGADGEIVYTEIDTRKWGGIDGWKARSGEFQEGRQTTWLWYRMLIRFDD